MPLLLPEDLQATLNIDLTDPNGQALATSLIATSTTFVSKYLGYPLEQSSQTTFFDGEFNRLWLPTGAPVSSLIMATYNSLTDEYETIDAAYVRNQGTAEVFVTTSLSNGFQSVKASYTTGWTSETLPEDLRQALIDMVGLKLQAVTNYSSDPSEVAASESEGSSGVPTGGLKKYSSGNYSEEYSDAESQARWKAKTAQLSRTIGDSLPAEIQEVLDRYRQSFAI